MRVRLTVFAGVVLMTALAGACSGGISADEKAAVTAVNERLASSEPVPFLKPTYPLDPEERSTDCIIGEGSNTGVAPMNARCQWKVTEKEGTKFIKLTETYKCVDFNERAGRDDFCKGEEGAHTWAFYIDARGTFGYAADEGAPAAESFYLDARNE